MHSPNLNVNGTLDRRGLMKAAGAGALALLAAGLLPETAEAQRGALDPVVLNFALNLEYLEGEFYSHALTGVSLEANGVATTGVGTTGPVTVKANPQVPFSNPAMRSIGEEIFLNERAHVQFIRQTLTTLGVTPIARPPIDLLNSFNALAAAAGISGGFDPFANETNFFLAVALFEDVGTTAYKGSARLLTNKDILENASGILAVEAYHASIGRVMTLNAGATAQTNFKKMSDLRDALDGNGDTDQGVANDGPPGGPVLPANISLADENAIVYSRTPRQVLNIVYSDPTGTAHSGGFFPQGANGNLR